MKNRLKETNGMALLTILIIIGIITVLISALLVMSRTEMGLSLIGGKQRQALYMAEAGTERFISELPYLSNIPRTDTHSVLGSNWAYDITPFPPNRGRPLIIGGDQGITYTTQSVGVIPATGGDSIRRRVEVSVLFRTLMAGGGPFKTPRYPWE